MVTESQSQIPAEFKNSPIDGNRSQSIVILDESEEQELPTRAVLAPQLYPDWESNHEEELEDELYYTKRDKWNNKMEFLMVLLSVAVGLGNVWRFPFKAYENGGGAFLIPYLVVVVVVARPLYFFELTVGQLCARNPVGVWDAVPLLRGVGWAIFVVSTITGLYYVAVLGTCLLYLYHGFHSTLPWGTCDPELFHKHSKESYLFKNNLTDFQCRTTTNNRTKRKETYGMYLGNPECNRTTGENCTVISTTELFYRYVVMQFKDDIEDGIGAPTWEMSVAMLIVWVFVFLIMSLGTKSSGKAAYFTALFPYIVLITLFGRACFLDGAWDGMLFLLKPDFAKIVKINVWYEAITQAFFSMGIGYGSVIVCGSFNPLHQTTYNDALIIGAADTLTSVLAALTAFAILGVLAKLTGKEIEDVVNPNAGLAFVSYPELMLHFGDPPWPQLFSFLFFTMLITLGIGSSVSIIHVVTAALEDQFPALSNKEWYKVALCGAVCLALYLFGLPFCTPGGEWMTEIFDYYAAGFVVFILVFLEIAGIAYFYGMKNFERDMLFMFTDYKCTINCKIFRYWGYSSPVFLLIVAVNMLATFEPLSLPVFGRDFSIPLWGAALGWSLFGLVIGIVPGYAIFVLFSRKTRSWYKKWMASVTPTRSWGPKIPEDKLSWIEFKQNYDGSTLLWRKLIGKLKLPPDPDIPHLKLGKHGSEGEHSASAPKLELQIEQSIENAGQEAN